MTMRELDRIIDELIDNKRCYFLYEVETQAKDEITKCVLRTSYDLDRDISIVFATSKDGKNIVKTAWLNDKNDRHFSLDKSKYYKPQRRF
jgi:acid phosphatase class B